MLRHSNRFEHDMWNVTFQKGTFVLGWHNNEKQFHVQSNYSKKEHIWPLMPPINGCVIRFNIYFYLKKIKLYYNDSFITNIWENEELPQIISPIVGGRGDFEINVNIKHCVKFKKKSQKSKIKMKI